MIDSLLGRKSSKNLIRKLRAVKGRQRTSASLSDHYPLQRVFYVMHLVPQA
jgi:hypothetical protein